MNLTLICDRRDGLRCASVWDGRELIDLYGDSDAKPDLTGAVVGGKLIRVLRDGKSGYLDCGEMGHVHVTSPKPLKAGDWLAAAITGVARHGKAWPAKPAHYEGATQTGLLVAPPAVWQRALVDHPDRKFGAISFTAADDYRACGRWLSKHRPSLLKALQPPDRLTKAADLHEWLAPLLSPQAPLKNGAQLVIETTEALAAIDVNADEGGNALATNLLAVREAARQIRLRNLSGIIVIDALKLKQRADNAKVLNALARALEGDPAKVNVFGITRLGLIELTRAGRGYALPEIAGD